jgi:PDZ domain/Aspartyl protease
MRHTLSLAVLAASISYSALAIAAPSVGQVLDANKTATGGAALADKATLKSDDALSGLGLPGKGVSITDLKDGRYVQTYTMGPASGAQGFDGTNAWEKDTSGTITLQQGGDQHALAISGAYLNTNAWWRADRGGAAIVSDGEKTFDGKPYDVLTVTPKGGKVFDAWFDAGTHLLSRTIQQQGSQTVTNTYSDYKPVDGVEIANKMTVDAGVGAKYIETVTILDSKFLPTQPDATYAPPKTTVNDFAIANGAAETTIPIRLINNHIYGPAKVNGQGPFTFIFDTGGADIVTPATARQLGLKVEGHLPTTGAGVKVMEGGFARVAELQVGGATVKNQLFIVMPLNTLADVEGTPMPGMVGFEVFRRFVTRVDYGGHTVTLIDPKTFDPKDAGTPIPFTFNGHIPEVMGTFEGLPAKFDIDTGSRDELTLTKPFADKNGLRAKHPKGVDAVDGWGVGGPSRAYVTLGKTMTLGPIKIDNVVTSLTTQTKGGFNDASYQGNVGSGILKRFIVTFDYDKRVLYLKPRPGPVADIGTFDRSGMWINQSDDGFKIVDVTKGGPAEKAGLKVGDELVAVDGKPAGSIHLYDLRRRLRDDAPGTVVTFAVKDGAASRDVKVTLEKQI